MIIPPCSSPRLLLYFAATVLIFSSACGNQKSEDKNHSANSHMNQSDFEALVQRFESPEREKWQKPEIVLKKMGDLKGKAIADLGAGTGYFSFRMSEKGAKVIAKDLDERFIQWIEQKALRLNDSFVKPQLVPYDDPLLEEKSMDAVLIVNTYHHIENRLDYFKKVYRGLKPGGFLLVVDFKKQESKHGPPVKMRLKGLKVIKELQKCGFSKTIIETELLPEQYLIKASKAKVQ